MSSRSMKHHSLGEIRICHSCENRNPGFPAKAGIQLLSEVPCFRRDCVWIPASAGMTIFLLWIDRSTWVESK
jgi:hypothetical protein